jgi:hypothetical protein
MPRISLHLFSAHCNLVKARFMPACLAMAALPGNLCATKGPQTIIDRSMA